MRKPREVRQFFPRSLIKDRIGIAPLGELPGKPDLTCFSFLFSFSKDTYDPSHGIRLWRQWTPQELEFPRSLEKVEAKGWCQPAEDLSPRRKFHSFDSFYTTLWKSAAWAVMMGATISFLFYFLSGPQRLTLGRCHCTSWLLFSTQQVCWLISLPRWG